MIHYGPFPVRSALKGRNAALEDPRSGAKCDNREILQRGSRALKETEWMTGVTVDIR